MTVLDTPRAVLFDMTGTLHGQRHVAMAAAAAVRFVLDRHHGPAIEEALPAVHEGLRLEFAAQAPSGFYLLRDILRGGHRRGWAKLGVEVPEETVVAAVDRFEAVFIKVVEPYPHAVRVLELLREHGIATGIVSVNDEQLLQDCVDACGLRPYVDVVVSSEAVQSCKPEPAMFLRGLELLGVDALDTVYVGDMPEMDVVGAARVGMRTVLTTEDSGFIPPVGDHGHDAVPDATITTLAELPAVLGLTT